jgi:phosphoglycolate phosphatase
MMKYDLVIFDMDGTILDTLEDLADSLNASLAYFGYPERTLEEVRRFVGNGIRLLVERGVPAGVTEEEKDRVYKYFMGYYREHCDRKTKPYPGILKLLESLRRDGCRLAVVSNKADSAVKALAKQYFPGMFHMALGEGAHTPKKPSPEGVAQVMEQLGVSRERSIYIGDSEVDIATARNAGLDSIIVTWGFREPDDLRQQGAEVFADTPEEIAQLIKSKKSHNL